MPTKSQTGRRPHRKAGHKPKENGRPTYVPNDQDKGQVIALASFGLGEAKISNFLGISNNTLRKHYADELDRSRIQVMGKAMTGLAKALNGEKEWAIKFTMMTLGRKYGWALRQERDKSVDDMLAGFDPSRLSPEKFAVLMDTLALAGANIDPALLPAPESMQTI